MTTTTQTKENPVSGFKNLVKDSTGVVRNKDRRGYFAARARKERRLAQQALDESKTSQIEDLQKQIEELKTLVNSLQSNTSKKKTTSTTTK